MHTTIYETDKQGLTAAKIQETYSTYFMVNIYYSKL